jgi:hypothetical protein
MVDTRDEVKADDRITGITVALFLALEATGHGAARQAQHLLVLEGT